MSFLVLFFYFALSFVLVPILWALERAIFFHSVSVSRHYRTCALSGWRLLFAAIKQNRQTKISFMLSLNLAIGTMEGNKLICVHFEFISHCSPSVSIVANVRFEIVFISYAHPYSRSRRPVAIFSCSLISRSHFLVPNFAFYTKRNWKIKKQTQGKRCEREFYIRHCGFWRKLFILTFESLVAVSHSFDNWKFSSVK